ncbi:MAG TPA: hypothetical protein ENK31_01555 [Nannocystis exedens]|nr:hypothetical protein [Nannocystis exedens]
MDPSEGAGAGGEGLVRAAKALGTQASLWVAEVEGEAPRELWSALHVLMSRSDALLLELQGGSFVLVRRLAGRRLWVDDPLTSAGRLIRRRELARRWPVQVQGRRQVRAVTIRASRAVVAPASSPGRISGLRCALRARSLRQELAGRSWPVEVVAPFVLTGDLSPERLRGDAGSQVRMVLDRLRLDFFSRDPSEPLVAYLFADDSSYRRHAMELFGGEPETPYGYFDPQQRALVINLATGGGTMVHEMVHPLLQANFPAAKPWLNEGLASLFEQSRDREGHLVGMPNWRLPGLHHALRSGRAPSFAELLASDEATFYGEHRGTYYALARYLLYYFQERGVLPQLWRELVRDGASDDGGLRVVKAMAGRLGHRDFVAFRRTWESFTLALHYP